MSSPEILAEADVTTATLEQIFKRAFFKTSYDSDNDLVVQTDGPKILVMVEENKNCCASRPTTVSKRHNRSP